MPQRLIIIDGKSVFYRGYYAMPNLATQDGTPTGGVYGFAVLALEVVKRLKPDYVCVAWDKAKTNIRSRLELYPQYKAGRKPPPPDFYEQIPVLYELLESLGWPLYEADDYEADDLMGAFAKQAGEKGVESYLITSDLDVLQLVNSHTHIFTLKKGLTNIDLFNEASFKEKYGVDAHQWIDVKALKGDSSDNIPGVAGIGEKGALELIKMYGNLDGVYENIELLKPGLRDKLLKDKEMAYLSLKLVTLMVDAPVKIDLAKAKLKEGVTPEFVALLKKLEFKQLLRQIESQLTTEQVEASRPDHEALEGLAVEEWSSAAENLNNPVLLHLSEELGEVWLADRNKVYKAPLNEIVEKTGIYQSFYKAIAGNPAAIIGQGLKKTIRSLLAADVPVVRVEHDIKLGAFLLNSLERTRELSDMLGFDIDMQDPGVVMAAIWRIYDAQLAAFQQAPKLYQLATDIEFPIVNVLAAMESRGILLNSEYLHEMGREFTNKISVLERGIYARAGQEFNISSPSQLATILFEKLALPTAGVKKGKTGYSTGANELDKLRNLHPIINLITEYREYTKLKSTYIDALPKYTDEEGRIHTTFTLDVAATGRLSSQDPNLQNIPTRTELGQAIRTAFVPAPGNVFVSADYSQFELRLVAVMAGDQQLIDDYNKDIDIHLATAAQVYGVPLEEVTKDMRRHAKTVNFGVLYGMSPHGLSVATGMSLFEAKDFITRYFELRAPVRAYIDKTLEIALETGYVETLFGRRRPTPDLKSSNFMVREGAKRAAANMPIQGTEADLMKMAMLEVEKKLVPDNLGRQLLQIHDSILVECAEADAEKVSEILKETMEHVHALPVKLKVDVSTGKNWGEL